tara:strand:+ start:257 stop:397 length:141 start_codon:yes stop_codon:yes gene_type:complete
MDKKINPEQSAVVDFHLKNLTTLTVYHMAEENATIAFMIPQKRRKQ